MRMNMTKAVAILLTGLAFAATPTARAEPGPKSLDQDMRVYLRTVVAELNAFEPGKNEKPKAQRARLAALLRQVLSDGHSLSLRRKRASLPAQTAAILETWNDGRKRINNQLPLVAAFEAGGNGTKAAATLKEAVKSYGSLCARTLSSLAALGAPTANGTSVPTPKPDVVPNETGTQSTDQYVSPRRLRMDIHDGWAPVNDQMLRVFEDVMAKRLGKPRTFDVAFELETASTPMQYPYILLEWKATDPHVLWRTSMQEVVEYIANVDTPTRLASALDQLSPAQPTLFRDQRMIVVRADLHQGEQDTQGVSALCFGAHGVLQIGYFARSGDFKRYLTQFTTMLTSIAFDPGHAFVPPSANQGIDALRLALARELVVELGIVPEALKQVKTKLKDQTTISSAFKLRLFDEMTRRQGELVEQVARVYADAFTDEDLVHLREFYASPLGKKLSGMETALADKIRQSASDWGVKIATDLQGGR